MRPLRKGALAARLAGRSWQRWAIAVVLLYLAVTAVGWGRSPNWDELWLLENTRLPLSQQLAAIRHDVAHPPLIYLLFRGWLAVFGHTNVAATGLVVVLNSLSLALFPWAAHCLTRSWRLATMLLAGVYLQIGSVVNLTRGYSLLFLCTIAAIALWTRWREESRGGWLLAWAAVMTIAVYTHYCGLLLLMGFVLVGLVLEARRWTVAAAAAIPVILTMPWLLYSFETYDAKANLMPPSLRWASDHGLRPGALDLPAALIAYIDPGNDPFGPPSPMQRAGTWRALRYYAWALHFAVLILLLRRWRTLLHPEGRDVETVRRFWTLLLIVAVPVAVLIAISMAIAPLFRPRFLAGLLPPYWLVLALAVDLTGRAGRALGYLGLLPAVAVAAVVTSVGYIGPSDLRTRVREVADEFRAGDVILADSAIGAHVSWEWRAVLGRSEAITTVRVGERGHIPFRERRQQNVVPYKDLWSVGTANSERIWYYCSRKRECEKAVGVLGGRGFSLAERYSADAFAKGMKFDLKKFVREGGASAGP